MIVDHLPQVRVLATGSSSFDLSNQTGEPLVGRKWEFELYPISQIELSSIEAPFQTEELLPQRIVYGGYPEVATTVGLSEKRELLSQIVNNNYFWRTYDQKEVDFVEARDGALFGFEFKWSKTKTRPVSLWLETYPETRYKSNTPDNYIPFIT